VLVKGLRRSSIGPNLAIPSRVRETFVYTRVEFAFACVLIKGSSRVKRQIETRDTEIVVFNRGPSGRVISSYARIATGPCDYLYSKIVSSRQRQCRQGIKSDKLLLASLLIKPVKLGEFQLHVVGSKNIVYPTFVDGLFLHEHDYQTPRGKLHRLFAATQ
jgi:hypothetical protein